ncbi:MAG: low molecular weight protein arginine phosphatase [Planctomycetes bacterium]|nr:low molecular weight protein arginine phosphatase [Planctomycetota bacterium]
MTISTILFVCTGNTCRSPLAEGLAQKWLKEHNHEGWLAVSAGIYAIDGMSTSSETLQALENRGISYDGTSTLLTEEMAKEATLVICMSESHLAVAKQFTEQAELLDPNGDVADPIGKGQSVYDALANQMEKLIGNRLHTLIGQGD